VAAQICSSVDYKQMLYAVLYSNTSAALRQMISMTTVLASPRSNTSRARSDQSACSTSGRRMFRDSSESANEAKTNGLVRCSSCGGKKTRQTNRLTQTVG